MDWNLFSSSYLVFIPPALLQARDAQMGAAQGNSPSALIYIINKLYTMT
jgi:hypothetical protein